MIFISALFGLCVGSFLNALIFRLREGKSVWRGRSQCQHCGKTLQWLELIPVLSFLAQKGRCRRCHRKISWQYPLVEMVTALLFVSAAFYNQFLIFNFQILIYWFIISVLLVIFVYDLRFGEIPDSISLPAIIILAILFWNDYFRWIGILTGAGWFALQYFVSRGRWVGGGDIRLGALMGAILGWPQILAALFIAYVSGAIVSLPLLLLKKKKLSLLPSEQATLPFGVFLVPATFITMWRGREIINWYFKFL